jgi:NADPH:quinone reductase-like Zn-dependent oxidoreductase
MGMIRYRPAGTGTASVQLAKQVGANVTAVCHTRNVELVRSLGADRVIDYLLEDFTNDGGRFDVVLDAVGEFSAMRGRRSLKAGGVYLTAGSAGSVARVLMMSLATRSSTRRVKLGFARYTQEDVVSAKELVEAGSYRPVIDRTYTLQDVVAAHRYVDMRQKTGNVVLMVDDRAQPPA